MNGLIENLLAQAKRAASHESSVTDGEKMFADIHSARDFFADLKRKIVQIREWEKHSGLSGYSHFDANGQPQPEKPLANGEYIRVSLPGSGKYDWIKVIEITETADEFVLTVQPAPDPTEPDAAGVSHFFSGDSTNNFCLQIEKTVVKFYVIGLDERTNTDDTAGTLETVRNAAAANLGYYFGVQKMEWKLFIDNFLKSNESQPAVSRRKS